MIWPSSSVARVTSVNTFSSHNCLKIVGQLLEKLFEDRVNTSSTIVNYVIGPRLDSKGPLAPCPT
jgi:hypothetical protein